MKIILLLNCCFALFMSCGSMGQNKSTSKEYDKILVGNWSGITTSKSTLKKNWKITRTADGKFRKDELFGIGGRKQRIKRTGNWWTKNGIYFEKNDNDETVVNFKYQLTIDKKITFKSEKSGDSPVEFSESKQ